MEIRDKHYVFHLSWLAYRLSCKQMVLVEFKELCEKSNLVINISLYQEEVFPAISLFLFQGPMFDKKVT